MVGSTESILPAMRILVSETEQLKGPDVIDWLDDSVVTNG
jgi:hypothetical protein